MTVSANVTVLDVIFVPGETVTGAIAPFVILAILDETRDEVILDLIAVIRRIHALSASAPRRLRHRAGTGPRTANANLATSANSHMEMIPRPKLSRAAA